MTISDVVGDFFTEEIKEGNYLIYAKDYIKRTGECSGCYILSEAESTKKKYKKITNNKHIQLVGSVYHV